MKSAGFDGGDDGIGGASAAIVRRNLERVRGDVEAAARRAGRSPDSVTIVGVTKSVGVREARWLLDAGVADLGENRPEQLLDKASDPALRGARWHLIGTYQRRKVRDSLHAIDVVHSVHSVELGRALSGRARDLGRTVDALVQVNVSGEASKQGFSAAEAPAALDLLRPLPAVRWRGLMTMAPADATPGACRAIFARTRELRDRLRDATLPLADLSMGMTSDFIEAVLEGATLIRVGTALFRVGSFRPDS